MARRRTTRISPKMAFRKSVVTAPRASTEVGRNDPCPCGSGLKYKNCCITKGDVFLRKLAAKERKARDGNIITRLLGRNKK